MILKIRDLSYVYKRYGCVLTNINAEFELGKSYSIISSDQRIATVLLGLLVKSDMNYDGLIEYDSKSIREISSDYYRSCCVSLVLKSGSLFGKMNALDNVMLRGTKNNELLSEVLEFVGLSSDLFKKSVHELNEMDKLRIVLAKALYGGYKVVLIDNLSDFVDVLEVESLLKRICELKNICVILTTNLNMIGNICNHKFIFSNGQLLQIK